MSYRLPTIDVKQYELVLREFCSSAFVDEESFAPNNVNLHMSFRLEYLSYQLMAVLRLPSKVLQDNKEVARFPTRRWDNFLVSVGLGKYAKFTALRANEFLTFPGIEWPRHMGTMRIAYTTDLGVAG